MNKNDYYEIDILNLLAHCFIKWKKIAIYMMIFTIVFTGLKVALFSAPSVSSNAYTEIETAITNRMAVENQLRQEQKKFEENLYYNMQPENIVTKRLVAIVELKDTGRITDRYDPTDTVLYAYNIGGRSQLRSEYLVPEILTKQQEEQLFSFDVDMDKNVMVATVTRDDEILVDRVISAVKNWINLVYSETALQTYRHKISFLPVAQLVYSQEQRETLVSTAVALESIRKLKTRITEYNIMLDTLFSRSGDWSSGQTTQMLYDRLNERKNEEASPAVTKYVIIGCVIGLSAGLLRVCCPIMFKNRLLRDGSIADYTGWQYIGRLKEIAVSADSIVRQGQKMLYTDIDKNIQWHKEEICGITQLLVNRLGYTQKPELGLCGNISGEKMQMIANTFTEYGYCVQTALLDEQRVKTINLCSQQQEIIFVADTDAVNINDVKKINDILALYEKAPLGYILV